MAITPPQSNWSGPADSKSAERLIGKGWLQGVALVMIFGFFVMGILAYRTYTASLLGQLLLEISSRGTDLHPDQTVLDQRRGSRDLSEYPHLQRLQTMLSADHSAAEFESMLESVLDRLERLVEVLPC